MSITKTLLLSFELESRKSAKECLKAAIKDIKYCRDKSAVENINMAKIFLLPRTESVVTGKNLQPEVGKCYLHHFDSHVLELRVFDIVGDYMLIECNNYFSDISKRWVCISHYKLRQEVPSVGWDKICEKQEEK